MKIDTKTRWQDLPPGGIIDEGGTSEDYETGGWRSQRPVWDCEKCISCFRCWISCPDSAIKIVNKRLSSPKWKTGVLGMVVRSNARVIEWAVTTFRAPASRLKKSGKTKDKTLVTRFARFFLRYDETPIVKHYDE